MWRRRRKPKEVGDRRKELQKCCKSINKPKLFIVLLNNEVCFAYFLQVQRISDNFYVVNLDSHYEEAIEIIDGLPTDDADIGGGAVYRCKKVVSHRVEKPTGKEASKKRQQLFGSFLYSRKASFQFISDLDRCPGIIRDYLNLDGNEVARAIYLRTPGVRASSLIPFDDQTEEQRAYERSLLSEERFLNIRTSNHQLKKGIQLK